MAKGTAGKLVSGTTQLKAGGKMKAGGGTATGINHTKSPANKKATGLGNSMKQGASKGKK